MRLLMRSGDHCAELEIDDTRVSVERAARLVASLYDHAASPPRLEATTGFHVERADHFEDADELVHHRRAR